MAPTTILVMKLKIKLRVCRVCGIKKRVEEFPGGKVCNTCSSENVSTLHESEEDLTDDLQSLHTKVDQLTQRLSRMEELMSGLMELVGKINYDIEISKAIDE